MSILSKITEEELDFMECFHTPRCLIESLFSNFDNLTEFDVEKFGEVRIYQMPLISDEILVDFDATAEYYRGKKNDSELEAFKFQLRKNVGDIYNYGGRKFGKSMVTIILDLIISMMHLSGTRSALASSSISKIRAILDRVKVVFKGHPIVKLWEKSIRSDSSKYVFQLKNNHKLESVNYKIGKKASASDSDWYGLHVHRVYIEEASLENESVAKARKDALGEDGAVMRFSGMTNFSRNSPSGQVFYDKDFQPWVVNLPQYVNPKFTAKENKDRLKALWRNR